MNIQKLTENLNIHQSLPDQPTMTTEQLKQEWDKAPNIIKDYINNILVDELNTQITSELEAMRKSILSSLKAIKPVGSLYLTTGNENPSTIFSGTTWKKIENRFLLGSGSRTPGSTGGEEKVALSIANMPAHSHTYERTWGTAVVDFDRTFNKEGIVSLYREPVESVSVGENQPHNNMPPYYVVHIWKRVS